MQLPIIQMLASFISSSQVLSPLVPRIFHVSFRYEPSQILLIIQTEFISHFVFWPGSLVPGVLLLFYAISS